MRITLATSAGAGLLVLTGLSMLLPAPGCGARDARTRLDTLRTDRERLTLVNDLPAGLSFDEARRRLPTLDPVATNPDGEVTEAAAPYPVLGHAATLTLGFGPDGLTRWTYRLTGADSATSASAYARLQGEYTMAFGNYHEEWKEETGGAMFRSFWSTSTLGLTAVFRARAGAGLLEWWFEPLESINRHNV